MQRYKIKIEYEGTPFVGWQFQKNGQSIQEVLQKAIFNFSKEKVVVIGAGRTDSGVHALAQVAHFDLKKKIKIKRKSLLPAINQNIGNKPVTVLKINKVNKKFHARFDAKKRTYQYTIVNRQSPLTLQKNKAWHIRKKLDVKAMKKGTKLLLGTHDFSTFRASSCGAKSPIKTMEKISIKKNKDKITLKFTSKSFLQQQVRSMVGCIKYLGEGKWNLDTFKNSLESKNRAKCAPPAPACGLYLAKIKY
ncbi:MAG TPA: tRNA pseudouridine(38-40) synthase TruA [Pelagibacteraceae bacterium]|jgi:tRNA pseudouridine38-40 synthase|nr:tRNA pseudouridine(38-40) synthase TruA [Pelagibacteraceae bacterium]